MTADTVLAAWNHRHRLRQSAAEARRGVFNPHHSVRAFRVTGPLDLAALERAWLGLQRRHPVLLSSFGPDHDRGGDRWRLTGADPVGLARPLSPATSAATTSARTASAPVSRAEDTLRRAAAEPFDIANGPLARLLVVPTAAPDTGHLVALVVEHLVTDGWSGTVLLRDLRALYAAEVGAPYDQLPRIEQDFAEFTARQNTYLESPAGRRLRQELAERPAGGSPLPDTPLKGFTGRTPVRHERHRRLDRTLDAAGYDLLLPLARSTRTTRLNLVLAAVHAALADLSGRRVVATTMTVSNRAHPSLRHSVGWFASKVVVASEPHSGADPLRRLDALRSAVAAGLEASRVPWPTQIHDHRTELFGTQATTPFLSFNAQPERMQETGGFADLFAGAQARPVPLPLGWQDAALATQWQERGPGGLRMTVDYKTDWYAETDVAALWDAVTGHLERLAHLPVPGGRAGRT
ncbi:condensation domain-containing protein [Streptomyces sp. NPDC102451]|uniref:condensation domain-containing protein n=1 Tax=Streptomyces sp. NPDC102451 TaxID=3366177 RepID=UPI0037F9F5BE